MRFIEPTSERPNQDSDYRHLPQDFIEWVETAVFGEGNPQDLDDRDYKMRSLQLENLLCLTEAAAALVDADEEYLKLVISVVDSEKTVEFSRPPLERLQGRADLSAFAEFPRFSEILIGLLREGYLSRDFMRNPSVDLVRSWFLNLAPADRVTHYLNSGIESSVICELENIDSCVTAPLMLLLISLIDSDFEKVLLYKECISPESLMDRCSPVYILRVWGLLTLDEGNFHEAFSQLNLKDQVLSLQTAKECFARQNGQEERAKDADYLKSDYPDIYQSVFEAVPELDQGIPNYKEISRISGKLGVIISKVFSSLQTIQYIEEVIAENASQLATKGLEEILNLIFVHSPDLRSLLWGPIEKDNQTSYRTMIDSISRTVLSEANWVDFENWILTVSSDGMITDWNGGLTNDFISSVLEIESDSTEPRKPVLWLAISTGEAIWDSPNIEVILNRLILSANEDPTEVRKILQLDVNDWGDPDLLAMWVSRVVNRWSETFLEINDHMNPTTPVSRYVRQYITDPSFRRFPDFFAESQDLLVQTESSDLPLNNRPSINLLVAAALGNETVQATIQDTSNQWIRLYLDQIADPNHGPDSLWMMYVDSGDTTRFPERIWTSIGIPRDQLLFHSLKEYLDENYPDISLGIHQWLAYLKSSPFSEDSLDDIQDVLEIVSSCNWSKDLVQNTQIVLYSQILRLDRNAVVNVELKDKMIVDSTSALHRLRSHLRDGTLDSSADCYIAFDAARVCGFTGTWWKALKPLVLAFRLLSEVVLNVNLSPKPSKSNPATKIPSVISQVLSSIPTIEDYKVLRRDMSKDLLNKLKPLKGNSQNRELVLPTHGYDGFDPSRTEPDPVWRTAFIQALGDLAVKQTGKGHFSTSTLKKVAEADLSPMVRDTAAKVVRELEGLRTGWGSGSHKRRIFHSWWWLRQAHCVALGVEIDKTEANRIRNTEFRKGIHEI